jgi:hypothetical protein
MTCEEGPETVFSMFYPTYLLSLRMSTSKFVETSDDVAEIRKDEYEYE